METDKEEILNAVEAVRRELKQEIEVSNQKLCVLSVSNQTVLVESITRLSNEVFLLKSRELESFLTLKDYLERIIKALEKEKP